MRDTFIIPAAPMRPQSAAAPGRAARPGALCLGVLDNSKGNADHLLGLLVEGLRSRRPLTSVVSVRKTNAAAGAPAGLLDRLAAEADAVVTAMAD